MSVNFMIDLKKYFYTMRYVFLNLKDHPRGNYMLKRLVAVGMVPELVIEEDSELAAQGRLVMESEIGPEHLIRQDSLICFESGKCVRCVSVPDHNDDQCRMLLDGMNVDLIVLGDCRVLRSKVFSMSRIGTINVHPGYLPLVRGNTPYIWASVNDLPQGCSIHFLDEGVDSGPLIDRREIDMSSVEDFKDLLRKINELCAELIVAALAEYESSGAIKSIEQHELLEERQKVNTFRLAPIEVRLAAIEKIKSHIL